MSESASLYDNSACANEPAEELALLLGVDVEDVEGEVYELCETATDNFDTDPKTSMSWDQVTRKGDMFDKNYYDGGSHWNEGEQHVYTWNFQPLCNFLFTSCFLWNRI
jgi:hypothetical protein